MQTILFSHSSHDVPDELSSQRKSNQINKMAFEIIHNELSHELSCCDCCFKGRVKRVILKFLIYMMHYCNCLNIWTSQHGDRLSGPKIRDRLYSKIHHTFYCFAFPSHRVNFWIIKVVEKPRPFSDFASILRQKSAEEKCNDSSFWIGKSLKFEEWLFCIFFFQVE